MLARHCARAGTSAQAVQHWLKAIKRAEARALYSEVFAQIDADTALAMQEKMSSSRSSMAS